MVYLIRERTRARLVQTAAMAGALVMILIFFLNSPLKDYLDNVYFALLENDPEQTLLSWGEEIQRAAKGTWLKDLLNNNETLEHIDQILSRRLLGSCPSVQVYTEGGAAAKLLGIGYANVPAYGREVHFMVEMDPLAVLLRHGIFGMALYYLPYLGFFAWAIVQFFRRPAQRLASLDYCTALYAVLMGFGISAIAGHALVSPAVATFILVTGMQLWAQTQEQNKLPRKTAGR